MGGEVTAGQPHDLEGEPAESFLREIDLAVFKGIFVAAAHQKREPTAVRRNGTCLNEISHWQFSNLESVASLSTTWP
jgi:hypothetical protein